MSYPYPAAPDGNPTPRPARLDVVKMVKTSALAGGIAATMALGAVRTARAGVPVSGSARAARPNIVFILSDDQRRDTLGCYGAKTGLTPNIDALAAGGACFTHACAVTSQCAPARINFLTGRFLSRFNQCPENQKSRLRVNPPTVANFLNRAGYTTGFIGKVHFQNGGIKGVPMKDIAKRMEKMGFDSVPSAHYCRFKPGDHIKYQAKDFDAAIKFITEAKARNKPFALLLFTTLVHGPTEAPKKYLDRVKAKSPRFGAGQAMAAWLDDEVGRLVGAVDKLGIRKNTAIFYATDHPPSFGFGNRGRNFPGDRNKSSVYEGWNPLIVNWPGVIRPGTVVREVVQNIDYLPTLVEMAGGQVPAAAKVDGRSFCPLLMGRKVAWPKTHYFEFGPARAVRTERYKYIALRPVKGMFKFENYARKYGGAKDLLFDLQADPCEKKNLFGDPKYAPALKEMQAKLRAHCSTFDYKFGEFGGGK
jgi:arylsulfatase A